jgi:hypothetical protein
LSSIPEAEAHEQVIKQSKESDDGSLGDVDRGDWYLVVPLDEVDLAEDSATLQAVGQVLHVWEWVRVRGGDGVEATLVTTGPPGAILFGDPGGV